MFADLLFGERGGEKRGGGGKEGRREVLGEFD